MRAIGTTVVLMLALAGLAPANAASPEIHDWNSLVITLDRGGCPGHCRSYKVAIHGDGTVVFDGGENIAVLGHHIAHVPLANVRALFAKFQAAHFMALRDAPRAASHDGHRRPDYDEVIPTTVELAFDGKRNRLTVTEGIPDFTDDIDRAAGEERWTKGNAETIAALKAEHWDFASSDPDHAALLAGLANTAPIDVVAAALDAGAPVNGPGRGGETPLFNAAARANGALVKLFIAHGADVNRHDRGGLTALMAAVEAGDTAIAALLIAAHADVNAVTRDATTVLMVAVNNRGSHDDGREAVARMLLAAGANVNARDWYHASALMAAAGESDAKFVAMLLAAHADPNAVDDAGDTVLMHVGKDDVAKASSPDGGGYTPETGAALIRAQGDAIRALVAAGAKVDARDSSGNTALLRITANTALAKDLLDAGANVNAQNAKGETPLARCGDAELAKLLLARGADPWIKAKDGTPAYSAAKNSAPAAAQVIDAWMAAHPRH